MLWRSPVVVALACCCGDHLLLWRSPVVVAITCYRDQAVIVAEEEAEMADARQGARAADDDDGSEAEAAERVTPPARKGGLVEMLSDDDGVGVPRSGHHSHHSHSIIIFIIVIIIIIISSSSSSSILSSISISLIIDSSSWNECPHRALRAKAVATAPCERRGHRYKTRGWPMGIRRRRRGARD